MDVTKTKITAIPDRTDLMSANRRLETLGDFVRRIRKEKHLSLADVSRQSARSGPRSASGINRIENDPKHRTTANKLTALANGLGIPAGELFARAVGTVPSGNPGDELELVARFRELSPERKADILKIVDLWYSEQIDYGD